MDQVIPGLWIGGLANALDVEGLKARNIHSIVTAMRGKITIHATFTTHQINIDDSAEEDVLVHFLPSISFIQQELDKGWGVLVHCQAGISRSATIVAAYLMHSLKIDPTGALDMIRQVRPHVEPNEGFVEQLDVFHKASYQFTRRDKAIRMFYMERTVGEIMNGSGSLPEIDMFADHPHTPSESVPATPVRPSRRIRCKMCRRELATREHMLDHGQLGPSTPAVPSLTPAGSRRPSMNDYLQQPGAGSRRSSASLNVSISRRPSTGQPRSGIGSGSNGAVEGRPAGLLAPGDRGILESLSMSALETEDEPDMDDTQEGGIPNGNGHGNGSMSRRSSGADTRPFKPSPLSMEGIGRDLSDALDALTSPNQEEEAEKDSNPLGPPQNLEIASRASFSQDQPSVAAPPPSAAMSQFTSPTDLAAQLFANPKLAGLRSPGGTGPPTMSNGSAGGVGRVAVSPPILVNPKCSGYFVEPMKWMEPFLESGALGGKIICPNKKCGAKLGNYDWAGVCCSCKEWVTPGFCIHRSKVDEIA
ncbi:hypothetical protein SERLA73DRAFT_69538 [Serpula lacrymans var. lacrymans S7.3]|uniref:protein-tyrosine-phosphatase n=2 Tax=Serpula lacrymans var. lacrymans TaxID=341189 RepID=F8PIR3_SERL3|nr:uncharacterized protein SERLADRAFT_433539 [Serpula lacrymans var. lacrymans S7.9]EGO03696.1 hypothetical protein SERLA73DRAFT_69538 [Serpula lacrymans var. lacrymans S7.3]EGO29559.1 hypothetical protein SERLADRAFT_433539 [Serpula lacrymans var. lacrymans S7.9]